MSEELKQLLKFLQREADYKRLISPTITQSELSMVLAHIRSLTLLHDAACNRSEYWKAEKLAADSEIDSLRARVAELEATVAQAVDGVWLHATSPEGMELELELDALKSSAAIAWGWLWHVTTEDDRVKTARHLLGQFLSLDMKRYGIQTAKAEGAQVNVQEIEAAMLRGVNDIRDRLAAAQQPAGGAA